MSRVTYELTNCSFKLAAEQQFPASPRTLRRLLAAYDIEPSRIQRLDGGMENETFLVECAGRDVILRVYRQNKKSLADILTELDFMAFLAEQNLAVPRLLFNRHGRIFTSTAIDGTRWHCIVMTRLPGRHPEGITPGLLTSMAKLQARLHTLGEEYTEYSLRHREQLELLASGAGSRLLLGTGSLIRTAAQGLLPYGFSHFDFTIGNLLTQRGHISGLLDFDDMTYGALAECLRISLRRLPRELQTWDTFRAYLDAYQTIRPLGRGERLYLALTLWPRTTRRHLPTRLTPVRLAQ